MNKSSLSRENISPDYAFSESNSVRVFLPLILTTVVILVQASSIIQGMCYSTFACLPKRLWSERILGF